MSEIFDELDQEINEELRRDKLINIWNQYGKYILIAIVLAVSCIIGYMSWRGHKEAAAIDSTKKIVEVLGQIEQGKILDAFTTLREVSDRSSGNTKTLLEMILAGLRLKAYEQRSGKINEIQEQELDELTVISKDKKRDILWRDLAVLTAVLYEFDILTTEELLEKLKPLISSDRPFMFSALEIMAHIYVKAGKFKEAIELFNQIVKDKNAPSGMRQRAGLMLKSSILQ